MKKISVVIFTMFFVSCIANSAFAVEENPAKEISGIIKDVQVDTSKSYTTLEFVDGRIVTFKGVYQGNVFRKGKNCTFKYQYIDYMFRPGIYIVNMGCEE